MRCKIAPYKRIGQIPCRTEKSIENEKVDYSKQFTSE